MATQKEITRNLMLYEYRLRHDAQTAFNNIIRAHGEQIASRRTIFNWFAKFHDDNTDLNDQPRSGRPREIDRGAVIEAIEEDPTLKTDELADDFECDATIIRTILKVAGKRWRKGR